MKTLATMLALPVVVMAVGGPPAATEQKLAHLVFYQTLVGRTHPVLTEGTLEYGLRYGLTSHYARVGVPAEGVAENTMLPVRILSTDGDTCRGTPAEEGRS